MRSQIELIDTMNKIENLVSAAQFLTANDGERKIQSELLDIVEAIARDAQETLEVN